MFLKIRTLTNISNVNNASQLLEGQTWKCGQNMKNCDEIKEAYAKCLIIDNAEGREICDTPEKLLRICNTEKSSPQ